MVKSEIMKKYSDAGAQSLAFTIVKPFTSSLFHHFISYLYDMTPIIEHKFLLGFAAMVSIMASLPRLIFINGLEEIMAQQLLTGELWWYSFLGGMLSTFGTMCFFLYFNAHWYPRLVPASWNHTRTWLLKLSLNVGFVLILAPIAARVQLFYLDQLSVPRFFNLLNILRFSFFSGLSILVLYLIAVLGRARRAERENWQLREEQMQSQLAYLKAQMNPHFLFNALNSLSATIRSGDKEEALSFVDKLSQVFRFSLQDNERDVIPLEEELNLVKAYLFLLQKRFGEKLQIKIDLPPTVLQTQIPPMALQLLVENAIKHNIVAKKKPLRLVIQVKENYLQVSNNYQPKLQKEEGFGIGLANLKKRYQLIAKKDLIILQEEGTFMVNLPLIPTTT